MRSEGAGRREPVGPPAPGTVLTVDAPAKVNLVLRILGRRADGYHDLETIFQAVDLRDTLELRILETREYDLRVEDAGGAPVDVGPAEDNLVTRAVARFRAAVGGALPGLAVRLVKRIPAGAGLGGGSSDAGACLRGLNELMGSPLDAGGLVSLGGRLGADVAFFSGTAACAAGRDRGDRLEPLPPLPVRTLVLGLPPVHVETRAAYGDLAASRRGHPVPAPVLDGILEGMRATPGDPWTAVAASAVNDFQEVVATTHPLVREALDVLRGLPVRLSLLSGSGAAVFALPGPDVPVAELLPRLRDRLPEVAWHAADTLADFPPPRRVDGGAGIH